MDIFKAFTLESAHRLPNVPAGHICARIHGRSFHVEIHVTRDVDTTVGWVVDLDDMQARFDPLYEHVAHNHPK